MMMPTKIGESKPLYLNLATDITTFNVKWLEHIQKDMDIGYISSFVILVHGKNRVVPDAAKPFAVYPLPDEKLTDFVERVCRSQKTTHFVSMRKTLLKNICLATSLAGVRVARRDVWKEINSWLVETFETYYPTKDSFQHKTIGI